MNSVIECTGDAGLTADLPSSWISEGPAVSTARFIERSFIPKHVARKTQAGRAHYFAILKHVVRPETVDHMLVSCKGMSNSKLKSIPGWPYLDDTRLCDISSDHVRRLTSLAASRGYSPQTVKHIKNVVSAIISHAKKERILSGENPTAEVVLPRIVRKSSHSISLIEAKTVFQMMGYPERQIALIILNSKMTASEVCCLRWSHINLTLRAVYVEGEIVPPRTILINYQRASTGLTPVISDRVRTIEISPPLFDLLDALKRQRSEHVHDDLLFPSRSGSPVSPVSIQVSKLRPIGRRLGIQFSWHTLKEIHEVFLQDLRSKLNSELSAL